MDIETLAEQDAECIERARTYLSGPSLVDFLRDEDVKELYELIYATSGFGDLIADHRPTYYRKDSALAAGYAAVDTDPVIVFLKPSITSENDLIEYTGMNTQFFLSQVAADRIIPIRAKAEKYRGKPFYESFFEEWRHHPELDGRYPIFGNAVEEVLDRDFNDRDFWRPKAKELAHEFDLVGETVRPTSELPERVATKYLAERLVYLRAVGQDTLADAIRRQLRQYERSLSGSKNSLLLLEDAAAMAFFSSMIYASPVFRSMGSTITMSRSDYANAVEWLNNAVEERRRRGRFEGEGGMQSIKSFIQLTAPVSKSILDRGDEGSTRITVPRGGQLQASNFRRMSNNETVAQTIEQTTEVQHRHSDELEAALLSGSFGSLSDSFEELREVRKNLRKTKMEEITSATDWLRTPINYASEVVGHLPTTPVPDDPANFVLNSLTSSETYDFFDAVLEMYQQKQLESFVEETPEMAMKGRVWESGYRWAERERVF